MNDLPNGFTGYSGISPDFESAADAMRKSRTEAPQTSHVNTPSPMRSSAPDGAFQYARDMSSGRRIQGELPFDLDRIDHLSSPERRWAWSEIDLGAIRHNVADVRRHLGSRTRLMAVVKADGYGHGAPEVSKVMLNAGADRLAVSNIDEAMQLRKAGVRAPILILAQPPASSIPLLLGYNVTPTIYNAEYAIAYAEAADLHGMMAPYHLAINTGMNRIGARTEEEVHEALSALNSAVRVRLTGTYTHFADADDADV